MKWSLCSDREALGELLRPMNPIFAGRDRGDAAVRPIEWERRWLPLPNKSNYWSIRSPSAMKNAFVQSHSISQPQRQRQGIKNSQIQSGPWLIDPEDPRCHRSARRLCRYPDRRAS